MHKKIIITIFTFVLLFSCCESWAYTEEDSEITTTEMSTAELLAKIAELQAQVAALQAQLNTQQGTAETFCYNFNYSLRYGDKGTEVAALQEALEKEGFDISDTEKSSKYFGDFTASAVVGFQNKYKEKILTPWGLSNGTGYVGSTTRSRLNALYGCSYELTEVKPYTPVVQSENKGKLVGYWRFDDASNLSLDSSGEGNPGVLYGDTTYSSNGVSGGALLLDGSEDKFDTTVYQNTSQTVSFWFKDLSNKDVPILGTHLRNDNVANFVIWTGGKMGCGVSVHGISSWDPADLCAGSQTEYKDGNWHFIALASHKNNHSLYVDGELEDTYSSFYLSDKRTVLVGPNARGQIYDYWFNGLLDELRIYSKALTAEEVKSLYEDINYDVPEDELPDLTLKSIDTNKYYNDNFDLSSFTFQLCNEGEADLYQSYSNIDVQVTINGITKTKGILSANLARGGCAFGGPQFLYKDFNLSIGKTYKVIALLDPKDEFSESNEGNNKAIFSLTVPGKEEEKLITVTYPNGGEFLEMGSKYNIRWTSSGLEADNKISEIVLKEKDLGRVKTIVSWTTNDGEYEWEIPTDLGAKDSYKIYIEYAINGVSASDFSDGYFSITDLPAPTQ